MQRAQPSQAQLEAQIEKAQRELEAKRAAQAAIEARDKARLEVQETSKRLLAETLTRLVERNIKLGYLDTKAFQLYLTHAVETEQRKRSVAELAFDILTHPIIGFNLGEAMVWNGDRYKSFGELATAIEESIIGTWDKRFETSKAGDWLVAMLENYSSTEDMQYPLNRKRSAVDVALKADEPMQAPDGLTIEHVQLLAAVGVGNSIF